MRFEDVIGNKEVKEALVRMAGNGRIPHAIMFHENEGCGALALIVAFLQYVNCAHQGEDDSCGECPVCNQISKLIYSDLHLVFPIAADKDNPTCESYLKPFRELFAKNPFFLENDLYEALRIEKKSSVINVAEAKRILGELSLSALSDGYRAVVIWLPEKMNAEASNRLLKEIEEPSEKTLFLFVTHNPDAVLKTIRSRCQLIRVVPAAKEEIAAALPRWTGVDETAATYAAEFASGSMGVAIRSLAEREDSAEMDEIFKTLINGILKKEYMTVLGVGEAIAGLDSREKQKAFCKFAGEGIRKIYMLQQNMGDVAGIRPEERSFYENAAARCGERFCQRALSAISKAHGMIVRNVYQKIVFTNMVNRLFVS